MAQFDIYGFDGLMEQLDRLGRFDEVAPKMLEGAVPILQEEVVKEASKHRDTGDMVRSIKPTGAIAGHTGKYYICVRPTGISSKRRYRRDRSNENRKRKWYMRKPAKKRAVRNMEKLVWLEFGVKGRAATPILRTATLNAAPKVRAKMKEVFNREMRA